MYDAKYHTERRTLAVLCHVEYDTERRALAVLYDNEYDTERRALAVLYDDEYDTERHTLPSCTMLHENERVRDKLRWTCVIS